MPKEFSSSDAKRLIEEHRKISKMLLSAETAPQRYKEKIKKAAQTIMLNELLKELSAIPVEELNRDKKGFRIKSLKDNGYNTLADIASVKEHRLAAVNGISEESAHEIKTEVAKMINEVRAGLRVKISADNKADDISALIQSIAQYKTSINYAQECKNILSQSENVIPYAVQDLTPAISGLKWMFLSSEKKERAVKSYYLLKDYLVSDYGQNAGKALAKVPKCENLTVDEAWEMFETTPVQFLNIIEKFVPDFLGSASDTSYGLSEELFQSINDEKLYLNGLLCELRPYQTLGVKYILHQGNVLLGDEMGLGKTVQAIASMVSLKNCGATHFMVICPASVLSNWCREIRKHSTLNVVKIHGEDRAEALALWHEQGGVAVTTYETTEHIAFEEGFSFSMLVVDEAHYIKNPEAKRTINAKRISVATDRILFMTGTALENNVDEMVSLIEALNPDIASQIYGIRSLSRSAQFQNKVSPVYYRRKREDVLTELPELIESDEWCELGYYENKLYEESVLEKHFQQARRVSWQVDDLNDSSKARRMLELIEEAKTDGRKIIVFSYFLETIEKISAFLGEDCTEPITGSVEPQRRQLIIDEFNAAPAGTVLLSQIQAGGTGLNIQSASVVIICEPQLKPSIENQAISRAYRMGQTRNVLVFRLLCEDSVDERISEILAEKQKIFDAFADESVAAKENAQINEEQMKDILNSEIERINTLRALQEPKEIQSETSEETQIEQ